MAIWHQLLNGLFQISAVTLNAVLALFFLIPMFLVFPVADRTKKASSAALPGWLGHGLFEVSFRVEI
jgi:hypothetical protein